MELLRAPLRATEFLVLDTETNGCSGNACELTEVGAVLVGGGELHERWESLVAVRAPLGRGIQRFTGITQAMVDEAPAAEAVLADVVAQLEGRVLVAHNAGFDRRVLRQACEREGIAWPDPPTVCTIALTRRFAPLVRRRALVEVAEALGIEVGVRHRALADAETCARVLCALLPRLCAQAASVGDALAALRPARRTRASSRATDGGRDGARRARASAYPDVSGLPDEPGVYLFRNAEGQVLYVGKSVSVRSRARAHFAASSHPSAWTGQAATVEYEPTASELGALMLEDELIKRYAPPGNARSKSVDSYVYLRCRFDIPFPVLEVAPEPAAGHAVNVGPLRGRASAVELLEQLNSLYELRHCGRALRRRSWASAYGQMGRCLSPCLGDLDPNLYRRRLDAALALFTHGGDGGDALLSHVDGQMRAAAAAQHFERAAWLLRRRDRLEELLRRVGGTLAATHARPVLVRAAHPLQPSRADLFWLVDGRVADWGEAPDGEQVVARTRSALARHDPRRPATHVPPDELAPLRIVTTWVAANEPPVLVLDPAPDDAAIAAFATG